MRKRTIGILLGMAVLAFASGRVSTAIDSVYAAEESDTSDDEEDEDEEEEDDSYTKELEQKRNNALDQIKSCLLYTSLPFPVLLLLLPLLLRRHLLQPVLQPLQWNFHILPV